MPTFGEIMKDLAQKRTELYALWNMTTGEVQEVTELQIAAIDLQIAALLRQARLKEAV